MKRTILQHLTVVAAALSLSACVSTLNTDIDELADARAAIAAAKAAGAEKCAPELQATAVASLYHAAHEMHEHDIHPEENAELAARAESKAKAARAKSLRGCAPEIIKLDGVNFANDSAELRPESIAILDRAVNTLKRRASIRVEVAAHTDSSASDEYNIALSNRRAAAVKSYLVSHGISASRLTSMGYGESQPIASNGTKEGRAKNRRVELRVLK